MIILAKRTGWGLAELLDMDADEFWAWLTASQAVENEIAQQTR